MNRSTSNLVAVLIVLFVVVVGVTGVVGSLKNDTDGVLGWLGGDTKTTTTTAVASTTSLNSGATTTTKTPATTTAPVVCAHPEHTKTETPKCKGCQVVVAHNYGEATYQSSNDGIHIERRVCFGCAYSSNNLNSLSCRLYYLYLLTFNFERKVNYV